MTGGKGVCRFGVSMDATLLKKFDRLLEGKGYATRSEAIRDLVRAELVRSDWQKGRGIQIGVLSLVYDHQKTDLQHKLTHRQHDHADLIVAGMHVHLDKHNCLEVLVLRGPTADVQNLAAHLQSIKGVKHGELVATTIGKSLQ